MYIFAHNLFFLLVFSSINPLIYLLMHSQELIGLISSLKIPLSSDFQFINVEAGYEMLDASFTDILFNYCRWNLFCSFTALICSVHYKITTLLFSSFFFLSLLSCLFYSIYLFIYLCLVFLATSVCQPINELP